MSNTFASLKRDRADALNKLTQELSKQNQNQANTNSGADTRFWKPTVDKAGNGQAIIRFLPAPVNEDVPFIRSWDHGFQGPGGWYIEKSLTTLGEKDPVSELNTRLWNSGIDADKEQVRKQKRRLHYISNIYVVKDQANPDNEGKVFLFQYGKKIFDKLTDAMNPEFEGEEKINAFDFWEGANFRLRIRQVDGYRNYDKSDFDNKRPLASDDEMEAIWKKQHSLSEFLDRKNFKTYDELKARLDKALGLTNQASQPRTQRATDVSPPWDEAPAQQASSDEDEDMSFFKKLASDD
jgi:hypothetical protein